MPEVKNRAHLDDCRQSIKRYIEVDCFEVDIDKLGTALNVTREMPHKRLEAALNILDGIIKNLTPESKKMWDDYQKQQDPSYWGER